MEIISTISLININGTLFVQLISFLIFVTIINRVMFRPLRKTIVERDAYVKGIRASIQRTEEEISAILDEIDAQESAARAKALSLAREMEETGSQESSRILSDTREKIKSQLIENHQMIEDQIGEALKDVKAQSESLADAITAKLLNREQQG